MPYVTKSHYDITFLTDMSSEEMQKVLMFLDNANKIIDEYFGLRTSFDIVICSGSWEMEVQVISRRRQLSLLQYDDTQCVAMTDYRLQEIIIRYDAAKFWSLFTRANTWNFKQKSFSTTQRRFSMVFYFAVNRTVQIRKTLISFMGRSPLCIPSKEISANCRR